MAKAIATDDQAPDNRLSGLKVTVEFLKTKDNEPRDIFVGVNAVNVLEGFEGR